MRLRALLAVVLLLSLLIGCSHRNGGGGGTPITPPIPPSDLDLELVASGIDVPVLVAAPRGDARVFIVEQAGRILVVKNGAVLPTPFLDVSAEITLSYEQGLLGLAFDPLYSTNHRFYVMRTGLSGEGELMRYTISGDPDVANPAGVLIMSFPDPHPDHNAGMLAFGPDGMLYGTIGDGGVQSDPDNHGQNNDDLLGCVYRLDVRTGNVVIPADNPWAPPAKTELWAIGLRNPWRFSFDRQTGDLYIADVGFASWEEIDVAPNATGRGRGANFGWKIMEGTHCFAPMTGCNTTGLTMPVLDYAHSGSACTVIGGYVYRGNAIPGLKGTYFYGDYCGGWVKSFYYSGGALSQQHEWAGLNTGGQPITSFGEDGAGELYVCTEPGNVYKIVEPPAGPGLVSRLGR